MNKSYSITSSINLNQFLSFINSKKQYLKNLKNIKPKTTKNNNGKTLQYLNSLNKQTSSEKANLSTHIIHIKFSRSNTLLHVTDFAGKLKFFYSAGCVGYFGKRKKSRYMVFRDLYRALISNITFLKTKPICLHLTNVTNSRFWIIKKIKKRFFVTTTKVFNLYPYNGCRKRKAKRKKFKKKR